MPALPNKTRVAFSVTNCVCFDQRVLKMAETVEKLNCEISIIGRRTGDYSDPEEIPYNTVRFNMIFRRGFIFYMFFNIRLLAYLLFHKYDLLVSNDLDTLLPNFIVSKLKRIPLVYDSHEYFTGVPEIQSKPFVKWVWMSIEKVIFPRLRNVITVSDPIAVLYKKLHNVEPLVVRNLSKNADEILPFPRKEIDVPENSLLVIIQGMGINIDKGAEELIETINLTEGVSLMVVGSGDIVPLLKQRVSELKIDHKVKFINGVPWETLMKYTKTADAGMCLEKNTNLNYRYSLPNKLFDYIAAGVPVIASDLPETHKILDENNCGIIINTVTPENISKALLTLKDNPSKLLELRENAVLASETLNWKLESEKVTKLYKKVMDS